MNPLHLPRALAALSLLAAPLGAQSPPDDAPGDSTLARRAPATRPERHDAPEGRRVALSATRDLRRLMTAPLTSHEGEELWVRTRDARGRFVPGGFTLYPVFGPASPQEWPIEFTLTGARRGAHAFDTTPNGAPTIAGGEARLPRADVLEAYRLDLDHFEQTFTFDALPGDGDLVLDIAVTTELLVGDTRDALRFVHPTLGSVTYGAAFALDAEGDRVDVARRWTGAGIELRVPAEFLATATLPLTIDPILATVASNFGIADDGSADVAYCAVPNQYMVCWEEFTSAVNSDVYVTMFDAATLTQSGALAIEMGVDNWTDPRIAYANGHDRALVVATINPGGVGGPNGSVRGRIVDPTAFTTPDPGFTISTVGVEKSGACVGGNSRDIALSTHFLVAWSTHVAAGDADVQYRVVDFDGTFVTPIVTIDDTAANDVQPAVSASQGDTSLAGDFWTLVWIRDSNDDGRGQVWARRVVWNGATASGNGNFVVNASTSCANPSVTSRFDEGLQQGGDRPAIVAYEQRFAEATHPSGFQRSIYLEAITDGASHGAVGLSSVLEDFDGTLDQWGPAIVREGKGFFVTYVEESWMAVGGGNWDMYAAAGSLVDRSNRVDFALSERHVALDLGPLRHFDGRVCSLYDGAVAATADDGLMIWTEETGTSNFGELHGVLFDSIAPNFLPDRAVGVQYCDANPNSVGTGGGRNSSWLWVQGTGSAAAQHLVVARDLPQFAFGYLLVSSATGNVNPAAGSQGRLCLGGAIGRYVNAIASSGASGVISTTIDPTALPQPTGSVAAAAGQTWNFQLWHRDAVFGIATSNFTNACAVTFTP